MLLLLLLVAGVTNTLAQHVTIRPSTGSVVSTITDESETGFQLGLGALWRHEQLALSLTASDVDDINAETGELSQPSAVLGVDPNTKMMTLIGGHRASYFVVSLPKGYRITGYKIVLVNNLLGDNKDVRPIDPETGNRKTLTRSDDNTGFSNLNGNGGTMQFYETPRWTTGSTESYNALNPSSFLEQAKAGDDGDINPGDVGKEFVIQRTSQNANDMGNQLYFRLMKNYFYYGVSIKSFDIYFTSEGTFTANVMPKYVSEAKSVVASPFHTSKVDIGDLAPHTKDGQTYFSYDYHNVTDIDAFNYLYQSDAVEDGAPKEGVAGVNKIVEMKVGGNYYYGLKNGTYYVETPVEVTSSGNKVVPIGYRIVGATVNYARGTDVTAHPETVERVEYTTTPYNTFYISAEGQTYTRTGSGSWQNPYQYTPNDPVTYYLTSDAGMSTDETQKALWFLDNEGYIRLVSSPSVYLKNQRVNNTNNRMATVNKSDSPARFAINGSGQITLAANTNMYLSLNVTNYNNTNYPQRIDYFRMIDNGTYKAERTEVGSFELYGPVTITEQVNVPKFTAEDYTLIIYQKDDKDGTKAFDPITVDSSNPSGSFPLGVLNNDAIKFEIQGVDGTDGMALITVDLQLQALDPYINKMDIVCESAEDPVTHEKLELSQPFTADDFSVSGGKFIFYVPTDYATQDLTFSFRDLYSQYGDTSYGGEGFSRYSFVTSPYFQAFDGVKNSATAAEGVTYDFDIDDTTEDKGLYDSRYNPEVSSTHKIYSLKAGNIRFKFNNAEDLSATGDQTGGYLEEYPFSVDKYLGSDDPDTNEDGSPTGKTGEFKEIVMNADPGQDKHSGIYFVFTSDETKYNIAPTDAWEHRSYAFYRMDIQLLAKQYIPSLEWTKIYESTSYADQDESGKDIEGYKAMWGLTVKAKDTDDAGNIIDLPEDSNGGYFSVKEIIEALEGTKDDQGQYVERHVGPSVGETGAPDTKDQILFIDGSGLNNIVASTGYSLEALRNELAPNSLVYLPENMTSTADNFAYKVSGSFMAGRNIVLTDRKPFYAPYDIQVGAAPNNITYTRNVTWEQNGKVTNASILVPFEIGVDANGLHDDGEGNKFTVHQISGTDALSPTSTKSIDNIHMLPVEGVRKTEPNVPYVVSVSAGDQPTDANTSFVVKQTGALLKASTGMNETTYEFTGTPGSGISDKSEVTFTPTGSFSGKVIPKSGNETLYYFGKNMFLQLGTLTSSELYVYPFRAYFRTEGDTYVDPQNLAKKLNIFFGENTNTTGVSHIEEEAVLVDPNAPVFDVYGRKIANSVREIAGKKLPRGIYVVKGVKFNVK